MSLLLKQSAKAVYLFPVFGVLLGFSSSAFAMDSDGNLSVAGTVSEPVAISSTITTVGSAVDVFDFEINDGGSGDGFSLDVSEIAWNTSGTATAAQWDKVTWRLNGAGASNATGTYSAGTNKLTFTGLSISVADGGNETYTLSAFFNDNTGLTDGASFVLSVDGDSDLTVAAGGTQMGSTAAVNNGVGSAIEVVATRLVYTTAPAGAVSGVALTTQPIVEAQDTAGNTDADFTGLVALSESSVGSVTSNLATAVSGVATFSGLTYTATADGENFTLTASESGSLSDAVSSSLSADVVATKLEYTAQPDPLSFDKDVAVALTTAPVVQAVDADGLLDTGFSGTITLFEQGATGTIAATMVGDVDTAANTVSLTAVAGVATFNDLSITYSSAGVLNETFTLQANAAGVTAVDSVSLAGIVDGVAPEIVSTLRQSPSTTSTNADSLTWRITFSEPVNNLNAADFVVNGTTAVVGSVTEITPQLVYDINVQGGDLAALDGTVQIGIVSEHDIKDIAGNEVANVGPTTSNENFYFIDNTKPTVVISAPSVVGTATGPVTYTLTFTGADNLALSGKVSLNTTGTASADLFITGSGSSERSVILNNVTGTGSVGIAVLSGAASDDAGNVSDASAASMTFSADNEAPLISIDAPSSLLTRNTDISYTVNYTGANTISLIAANVQLHKTGTANGIVSVTGTGTDTRTVSIGSIVGTGTLNIGLVAATASDTLGNQTLAVVSATPVTVDNTSPTVNISAPSQSITQSGPVSFTLSYTGANSISLSAADVTLNKTGSADGTVSVSGSGSSARTVTISSISGEGSLGIAVAANTALDAAGNAAVASAASATFNVDSSAPRVVSILRQSPAATPTNADTLVWRLSFDSDVVNVDASDFALSGTTATVTSVSPVAGNRSFDVTVSGGDLSVLDGTVQLGFALGQDVVDVVAQPLVDLVPVGSHENQYVVDNTAPSFVLTMSDVSLLDSETAQLAFTFTEEVLGFSSTDITTAENGTISAFAANPSDAKVFTATFIPNSGVVDNSNVISVLASSYTDLAGNAGAGGSSPNYSISDASTNATEKIKLAAGNDNASSVTAEDINTVSGVSGALTENIDAYRVAIEALISDELDSALEIQALVDSVNVLEKVKAAAVSSDASAILFSDLNLISGVLGAVSLYETQYQSEIAKASVEQVDSAAEIQALVASVNALEKVKAAAKASDASGVSIADLNVILGVSGAVLLNEVKYQSAIAASSEADVGIANRVFVLLKQVDAIAVISTYAGDNTNTAPTESDYLNAGLRGVNAVNLSDVNISVDNVSESEVDTLAEIRGVVGIRVLDSDADGVADVNDEDDDNDGVLDRFENPNVDKLTGIDSNSNGIDDGQDAAILAQPDANGDGIVDELALADTDGDGVPNLLDLDSDNDGLPDSVEYASVAVDSDGDGMVDGFRDDNRDGVYDFSSLLPPVDTDGDGLMNIHDLDSDGDSKFDLVETGGGQLDFDQDGSIDSESDADRDGLRDVVDTVNTLGSIGRKLAPSDADGDGIIDYLDSDAVSEVVAPTAPPVAPMEPRKTASLSLWLFMMFILTNLLRVEIKGDRPRFCCEKY